MGGYLLRLYRPSWSAAWPAALIVGGLLVLFALYVSFGRWGGVFRRRSARYGLNAAVMVILIFGVLWTMIFRFALFIALSGSVTPVGTGLGG